MPFKVAWRELPNVVSATGTAAARHEARLDDKNADLGAAFYVDARWHAAPGIAQDVERRCRSGTRPLHICLLFIVVV
jgi:hypothetical protein